MIEEIIIPENHQGHGCIIKSSIVESYIFYWRFEIEFLMFEVKRNDWFEKVIDQLFSCTVMENSTFAMSPDA